MGFCVGNDLKQSIPPPRTNAPSKTLDEITNKVYEDILQEKSESGFSKQKSDKGSVKVSVLYLKTNTYLLFACLYYRVRIGVQNIRLEFLEDL